MRQSFFPLELESAEATKASQFAPRKKNPLVPRVVKNQQQTKLYPA